MADKILKSGNNAFIVGDNLLKVDVPVELESKTKFFNLVNSVESISIEGITREPQYITLVALSSMNNVISYIMYNKTGFKTGRYDRDIYKTIVFKGYSFGLAFNDENDETKPNWKWNSDTNTVTFHHGTGSDYQSTKFYRDYTVTVLY